MTLVNVAKDLYEAKAQTFQKVAEWNKIQERRKPDQSNPELRLMNALKKLPNNILEWLKPVIKMMLS